MEALAASNANHQAMQLAAKYAESGTAVPSSHKGLSALNVEYDYQLTEFEGDWPEDLRGSFYRNGPGRLEFAGTQYGHWFDGDGMVNAFHINDQGIRYVNKYVRTKKYVEEEKAGKVLYRGIGTQIPGGFIKNALRPPTTNANTSIVYHGDKLLALAEGWWPYELDRDNLKTVGPYNYDKGLRMQETFSAHGKVNPKTGDYFNFGFGVDVIKRRPQPVINLYRIDKSGRLVKKNKIKLPRMAFLHDFAMSEKYAFFMVSSIGSSGGLKLAQALLGFKSLKELLTYRPDLPAIAMVIDLDTMQPVLQQEMPPHAVVHFGNAWETGNELTVQAMHFDNFDAATALNDMWHAERVDAGHLCHYKINLSTKKIDIEPVVDNQLECEFPQWQPRLTTKKSKYVWLASTVDNGANAFFNAMQKVDTKTGKAKILELPKGYYASEPMPVLNKRKEDDGYILNVVYNAWEHKSELWCLDASDMQLRAKAFLNHHVPHGFHGYWLDASRL